jgi:hypothetical protein
MTSSKRGHRRGRERLMPLADDIQVVDDRTLFERPYESLAAGVKRAGSNRVAFGRRPPVQARGQRDMNGQLSEIRCSGRAPVASMASREFRLPAGALTVIHPKIGQSAKPKLIMSQRSRCRETQIEEPPVVPRRLQNVLRLSTVAPRSDRRSLKLGSTTYSGYQGRWRPGVTLSRRANFQKSGLSVRGTAEVFPGYHWRFSAQTSSSRSSRARRNVTVADQGTVKAPSSSTVTWICSPLPL